MKLVIPNPRNLSDNWSKDGRPLQVTVPISPIKDHNDEFSLTAKIIQRALASPSRINFEVSDYLVDGQPLRYISRIWTYQRLFGAVAIAFELSDDQISPVLRPYSVQTKDRTMFAAPREDGTLDWSFEGKLPRLTDSDPLLGVLEKFLGRLEANEDNWYYTSDFYLWGADYFGREKGSYIYEVRDERFGYKAIRQVRRSWLYWKKDRGDKIRLHFKRERHNAFSPLFFRSNVPPDEMQAARAMMFSINPAYRHWHCYRPRTLAGLETEETAVENPRCYECQPQPRILRAYRPFFPKEYLGEYTWPKPMPPGS